MDILLTRHGQTEWNVLKKVQGRADIELNSTGIEQAEITAEKLFNEKFDLIIVSPLKRALQTAEIINKNKNVSMIIDHRLAERDFGEFEGLKTSDFNFEEFWSYKANVEYKKAENIKDFFKRIYDFLDDIKVKYNDKKVLLVTHGGVSIPIKCYFRGIPDENTLLPLAIGNCEIEKFLNV